MVHTQNTSTDQRLKGKSMVSVFNRKGKLYLQFTVNQKKYQKSSRLEDTPSNRKILKNNVIPKLEASIISGEFEKAQEKDKVKKFSYYGDIYLQKKENIKSYKEYEGIVINQLYPEFAKCDIDKVSRSMIIKFTDKKLKSITVKRYRNILNILSAILNLALDYEIIETNPALNIKLPQHQPVKEMLPFTKNEVDLLLANAADWFCNYLAIAFYSGARTGELLALRWSDVDLEKKVISIDKRIKDGKLDTPKTKAGIRLIPILDDMLPYLEDQYKLCLQYKSLTVFYNYRKTTPKDTKMLYPQWKRLLEKTKLKYRPIYNTRHTFITNALRSGINTLDIAQMVGHENTSMITQTYAKYLKNEHLHINRSFDIFSGSTSNNISSRLEFNSHIRN